MRLVNHRNLKQGGQGLPPKSRGRRIMEFNQPLVPARPLKGDSKSVKD